MFKAARTHLALVIDEYGAVDGLVTTNDILEAIVGDIAPVQSEAGKDPVQREDGSWLLEGAWPVDLRFEIVDMDGNRIDKVLVKATGVAGGPTIS